MKYFDFLAKVDSLLALGVAIILLIIIIFSYFATKKFSKGNSSSSELDDLYLKIKEDIKFAVAPKFVDLSLGVNDLVDLAVEIWRMEQRIQKSMASIPENQGKGLENSIQKLKRYIEKYDIEIVDYKNQKYNDGLSLDVLSVEKNPTLSESIIKETIEPTILCKGQVVRKAKIILITN